jgi:hypothetical protein
MNDLIRNRVAAQRRVSRSLVHAASVNAPVGGAIVDGDLGIGRGGTASWRRPAVDSVDDQMNRDIRLAVGVFRGRLSVDDFHDLRRR